ncbi:MAG: hypothetical protein Q9P01_07305 [Anaerolineae bacterium]|nr:hypothetical protein [Anaerolineae bacterium]MDQ7034633.1 hypothetical protein [Anaerolineae bacterium]
MYSEQETESILHQPIPFDTNRWTAHIYTVQFEQVSIMQPEPDEEATFAVSAWGLSKNLSSLLTDYSDKHVREATEWLTLQQNALVADVLEQMQYSGQAIPPLEHLFIAIDGELFLPYGLRMLVTCITNIVPRGNPSDGLDKFVAILDPSETDSYVSERKDVSLPMFGERIH